MVFNEHLVRLGRGRGGGSVLIGLKASYGFDTPTAPSIVCAAVVFFTVFSIVSLLLNRN